MDRKPNINTTSRLPRQVKGGFPLMLDTPVANFVLSICEAVANLKINVPVTDGTNTLDTLLAQIKLGDMGMEVTMPPQGLPGSGGTSTAQLQQFSFINDAGDYYSCQMVIGGVPSGPSMQVLKPYKLRQSLASEVIQNISHAYTYAIAFTDSNGVVTIQRTDASGGISVNQQIIPDAILGDEIWAVSCNIIFNGLTYLWLDTNADGRNWTEIPAV